MEKTASNNRPKLELALNEAIKVKLLKDKPYEGNSPFGSYLLYSVEQEGIEKAYFAPPEVHQKIVDLGFAAGDELILKKVALQNGRKVVSRITVEQVNKPTAVAPEISPEKSNGQQLKDNLKSIMEQSIKEAVEITSSVKGVPFQNEDIQKIASCLFIART